MGHMTVHRFYAPILGTPTVDLDAQEAHHASGVLRLKLGDAVELFDGKGATAVGKISVCGKRSVTVAVEQVSRCERPSRMHLTLATAMPRSARQPFLFEKCTELGVGAIRPVTFERSVVKATSANLTKWRRTIIESGKQCRTAFLPENLPPLSFEKALAEVSGGPVQWVCTPNARASIAEQIKQCVEDAECIVWIGPEGGMTDDEQSKLKDRGAVAIRIAENVLRIETAALAVASAFAICR